MAHRRHFQLSSGQLYGRDIVFHVNSRFRVSLIDSAELDRTGYAQDFTTVPLQTTEPLCLPNGAELTVEGAVCVPIKFRGQHYKQVFMVLNGLGRATEPNPIKALIGSDLLRLPHLRDYPLDWD